MMLPGVELNNSVDDHAPYQSLRMARFEGSSWKLIDDSTTSGQASTAK
jgi:branched-chain amino acid transport system substrate-binding protein